MRSKNENYFDDSRSPWFIFVIYFHSDTIIYTPYHLKNNCFGLDKYNQSENDA